MALFGLEDQAAGLRRGPSSKEESIFRLFQSADDILMPPRVKPPKQETPLPPLVAIASGKGGVGKTFFSVNLALDWHSQGKKCAVMDLDWGLGNLDIALGIAPQKHLGHVLFGECSVAEALLNYEGLLLLPNACGESFHEYSLSEQLDYVMRGIVATEPSCNLIVADTHPGLGPATVDVIRRATATVVVSTPEPTAITDTYALFKVLYQEPLKGSVGLVINQAPSAERAQEAAERLNAVAMRFLGQEIPYWGYVPQDSTVSQSVCNQRPLLKSAPWGRTSVALRSIGETVSTVVAAYQRQEALQNALKESL